MHRTGPVCTRKAVAQRLIPQSRIARGHLYLLALGPYCWLLVVVYRPLVLPYANISTTHRQQHACRHIAGFSTKPPIMQRPPGTDPRGQCRTSRSVGR
eukprot:816648-Rhodomonas_salina.7